MGEKVFRFIKNNIVIMTIFVFIPIISSFLYFSYVKNSIQTKNSASIVASIKAVNQDILIRDLNKLNFALSNEYIIEKIEQKDYLLLIRYLNKVINIYSLDGSIIISDNGEIIAKSDFLKIPFNDKIGAIVNSVFKGQVFSNIIKVGYNDLEEGLKFNFRQKNPDYGNNQNLSSNIYLWFIGIPIYDKKSELKGAFLGVRILNGDKSFLSQYLLPSTENIAFYDDAMLEVTTLQKIEKKPSLDMSHSDNYYVNNKKNYLIVKVQGYQPEDSYLIYVKIDPVAIHNKYLYILNALVVIGLFVFLFLIRKQIVKQIVVPLNKVGDFILKIEKKEYDLPLLSANLKSSMFYDYLKSLLSIAQRLKKNGE